MTQKFLTISRLLKNSFDVLGRHSCGSRNPGFPVKTGIQIFFTGSPLPRGQSLDSRSLLNTCRDKFRGSDGKTKCFRILLENSNFEFVSVPRFAGSIFGFRIYPRPLFFNIFQSAAFTLAPFFNLRGGFSTTWSPAFRPMSTSTMSPMRAPVVTDVS